MNKLITKILKESNVSAKITNDSKRPKFRVKNGQLTLEGIVTSNRYSMKITDNKGEIIDEYKVSIKDSNDIVNRINESITTLNKLSPIYDNQIKLKEDEEFEDLPEAEPGDIRGALTQLRIAYDTIMEIADSVSRIGDYYEDSDVDGKQNIISFVSGLYDIAADIDEYREDCIEELEADVDTESYRPKRSPKSASKMALEHIILATEALHGQSEYRDIRKAMKDIKSELTIRGNRT